MDTEKCNPVSTPGLQVTEKDLATEGQLPELLVGRIVSTSDGSTSLMLEDSDQILNKLWVSLREE